MGIKTCSACKERKLFSQFSRDASRRDGLQARCKGCDSAARMACYARDRAAGKPRPRTVNHFDYQWFGMPKWQRRPSDRVGAALRRLSRDRWLAPMEVRRTALALASCCSHNPPWTAKRWLESDFAQVGMALGEPPLSRFDDGYRELVRIVAAVKRWDRLDGEVAVINFFAQRRKTNG